MTADSEADGVALLQAQLAALRRDGAWRHDPPSFRFLESLAGRLEGQSAPVRQLLLARLRTGLADYAARAAGAREPGPARRPAATARDLAGAAPLAALNRYIHDASLAKRQAEDAVGGETARGDELASVRRFQRAWAGSRAQHQVAQAAARKPRNAGPLNSHGLALQSLALMEALSPEYLQRFVMHVETLQWLAAAADKPADSKPRPATAAPRRRARK